MIASNGDRVLHSPARQFNMELPQELSVQMTMSEDFGVGDRGAFYETAGTLRDVVENHLFQIVALLAMEPPKSRGFADLQAAKAAVFKLPSFSARSALPAAANRRAGRPRRVAGPCDADGGGPRPGGGPFRKKKLNRKCTRYVHDKLRLNLLKHY